MIEFRQFLGYEGLEGSQVRLIDEEFEFTGDPRTPPSSLSDNEIIDS